MRFTALPRWSAPLRAPARALLAPLRAAPAWGHAALASRGRGPLVVFLPSRGREQSARLRIYDVATALRPLGWRTVVLPWTLTLSQRQAMLRHLDPDIVVMQGARHSLNRPGLYPGQCIIYDMDDADFHLPHLATPVAAAMPQVSAVLAGSGYIAQWCRAAGAPTAEVVWTGTPVSTAPRPAHDSRPLVIAWAQTRPASYVREAAVVRDFCQRLARRRPGITLRLYDRRPGDDVAFAESFAVPGLTVEWRTTCAYPAYLRSFDDVALGLAPLCPETPFSRGKSFGKVLAYLDRKVPVIGSLAGEHPAFFTEETGVITNDHAAWPGLADHLLSHPAARQDMADRAFEAFRSRLSIDAAAARVSGILAGCCDRSISMAG